MDDITRASHRRYNPLTDEWILVSPARLARPWLGESSPPAATVRPAYDPSCYLCPGNARAGGERNPAYEHTFVFDNDFAALQQLAHGGRFDEAGLLVAATESGRCRVLCFSPRHDLDIATMPVTAVRSVVDAWAAEYRSLAAQPNINAVTIFENRGAMMGASNPHPHGQIWTNQSIPSRLLRESVMQARYLDGTGNCLLCAYIQTELRDGARVVYADEAMCVVVPFWAEWPFETMVLPRRHVTALDELEDGERSALAITLHELAARYDRVFAATFPYSMGFHQRPTDGTAYPQWHAHGHYYPPLLRSANVRKYAVGYEMLAQAQRDLTPEDAARRLREV